MPSGDWDAGERGIACHPGRVSEFREGVDEAIMYARALGVKQVNCLAGIVPHGVHREAAQETFVVQPDVRRGQAETRPAYGC